MNGSLTAGDAQYDAGRSDDARFDFSPRFPSTGAKTFPANIAFVGFGRSYLRNRHQKIAYRAEKREAACEPLG